MNKTTLTQSLFLAGAVALAGAAHADAIFYPDGTMVELGSDTALEQMAASDSTVLIGTCETCVDTTALGAGPATVTTTTSTTAVPVVRYEYVQPNIDFDRATVVSQMRLHPRGVNSHPTVVEKQSAATFDVPQRAGEASTMTGGAPNMVTDNNAIIVGSTTIPYSSITVGQPYYVMSF